MSNIDGDWSGTEAGQQLEKVNMTAAEKVASITPDEFLLRTRRLVQLGLWPDDLDSR